MSVFYFYFYREFSLAFPPFYQPSKPDKSMKIAGIGWHKTGTTTLCHCLREFGYHHRSWKPEDFKLWREGEHEALIRLAGDYESCDDFPWPFLFRELDERFPGTRFILTLRRNPETWYRSICKHASRTGPLKYREWVYDHDMPHEHRERFLQLYEGHNKAVRDYFANRPDDLLEVCWEEGHGWRELADFLGEKIPERPFPHANRSPAEQEESGADPRLNEPPEKSQA